MKTKSTLAILIISIFLISCSQTSSDQSNTSGDKEISANQPEEVVEEEAVEIDIDQLIADIDSIRSHAETNIGEPIRLQTTELRAKINQKWAHIDYYTVEDQLVRIKTHPHSSISERTEEFYFSQGNLVLVVIEDNGNGNKGKSKDELDKLYYYHNDSPIKEVNKGTETEYNFKESDAEELLTEAKEYMALFEDIDENRN